MMCSTLTRPSGGGALPMALHTIWHGSKGDNVAAQRTEVSQHKEPAARCVLTKVWSWVQGHPPWALSNCVARVYAAGPLVLHAPAY
jgi:hypothetical protein